MIRAAIIGASGYTGVESIEIILRHPSAKLTYLTALPEECGHVADMFGQLRGRLDMQVERSIWASWHRSPMSPCAVCRTKSRWPLCPSCSKPASKSSTSAPIIELRTWRSMRSTTSRTPTARIWLTPSMACRNCSEIRSKKLRSSPTPAAIRQAHRWHWPPCTKTS